jgi:hypothetical protein
VALRCEKTAQNYGSFVALALGLILVKSVHTAWVGRNTAACATPRSASARKSGACAQRRDDEDGAKCCRSRSGAGTGTAGLTRGVLENTLVACVLVGVHGTCELSARLLPFSRLRHPTGYEQSRSLFSSEGTP